MNKHLIINIRVELLSLCDYISEPGASLLYVAHLCIKHKYDGSTFLKMSFVLTNLGGVSWEIFDGKLDVLVICNFWI